MFKNWFAVVGEKIVNKNQLFIVVNDWNLFNSSGLKTTSAQSGVCAVLMDTFLVMIFSFDVCVFQTASLTESGSWVSSSPVVARMLCFMPLHHPVYLGIPQKK